MSNDNKEKVFLDGLIFKAPKESAPDWVLSKVSIKVDEFITSLKDNEKKGWVNLEMKRAQNGNYYMEVDTWEPDPSKAKANSEEEEAPF